MSPSSLDRYDPERAWDEVVAIPAPSLARPAVDPGPVPRLEEAVGRWRGRWLGIEALAAVTAASGGLLASPALGSALSIAWTLTVGGLALALRGTTPYGRERARRHRTEREAAAALRRFERKRAAVAAPFVSRFTSRRVPLEVAARRYRAQHEALRAELERLERGSAQAAFEAYLRTRRIAQEGIPQIGAARAQTLASHGILTAYDMYSKGVLTRGVEAIPGFGEALCDQLLNWYSRVEREYRAPPVAIESSALHAVEVKYAPAFHDFERVMREGRRELEVIAAEATPMLAPFEDTLRELTLAHSRAHVAARALDTPHPFNWLWVAVTVCVVATMIGSRGPVRTGASPRRTPPAPAGNSGNAQNIGAPSGHSNVDAPSRPSAVPSPSSEAVAPAPDRSPLAPTAASPPSPTPAQSSNGAPEDPSPRPAPTGPSPSPRASLPPSRGASPIPLPAPSPSPTRRGPRDW